MWSQHEANGSAFIAFRRTAGDRPAQAVALAWSAGGQQVYIDRTLARDAEERAAILAQIAQHDHFVLVVVPRTLEGCTDPHDWLRAQIERALATQREIFCLLSPQMDRRTFQASLDRLGAPFVAGLTATTPAPLDYKAMPGAPAFWEAQSAYERANSRPLDDTAGRIADYDTAIALDPDFAEAYARRGANRDLLGDADGARADLDTAIRLKSDLDIAYVNRGMLLANHGDREQALSDFDTALSLNPALIQAHFQRGQLCAALGQIDAALEDYSRVIAMNPASSAAYFHRGMAHAKRDLDAAIADWTEAIRLDPGFLEAYYNRGLVRANRGDLPGTLDDMAHVLALVPDQSSPFAGQVRAMLESLRGQLG